MGNMTMQQKTYWKLLALTQMWKAVQMRKNKTQIIVLLINKIIKSKLFYNFIIYQLNLI